MSEDVEVPDQEEPQDRPRRFRRFRGLMGGVRLLFDGTILLLVMLIIGFIVFANGMDRERREPAYAADGITVLTGGVARIDEAMKLLAKRKAKRVLITGVNRGTTLKQLKALSSQGDQYFACCVDIDKEARNTIDNATETAQWVTLNQYSSIIVVTSNYHMPRALAELERAIPGVALIPYPVVDNNVHVERWWHYPGTTRLLLSEYLKYLPALGRLWATNLARMTLQGTSVPPEDEPEP
ncbi:MAG: YdcF family protein [Methyloceanibacter sp.]|uniref:YdcF family protein n=1 Tax=Methyloceanibacter sp. TaxID=1965321 RepID=UPI003EE2C544